MKKVPCFRNQDFFFLWPDEAQLQKWLVMKIIDRTEDYLVILYFQLAL